MGCSVANLSSHPTRVDQLHYCCKQVNKQCASHAGKPSPAKENDEQKKTALEKSVGGDEEEEEWLPSQMGLDARLALINPTAAVLSDRQTLQCRRANEVYRLLQVSYLSS